MALQIMNRTLLIVTAFLPLQISMLKKVLLQFSPIIKENYVWQLHEMTEYKNVLKGKIKYLFIILFSVFVNTVSGQITQPTAWTKAYDQTSSTGTGTSFAVAAGTNRILVVGITTTFNNNGNGTQADPSTISYGGVTLTKAVGNGGTNGRMHTWLYYLKDNAVMDATSRALNVTAGAVSAASLANMTVWYGVFAGVDQSPAAYTTGNVLDNTGTNGPAQLSGVMAVNTNEQAIYISSIYNANSGTIPVYTLNSNWTSGGFNTGTNTSRGNTVAWKNQAANRNIPVSNTTDSAFTSSITPSGDNFRWAISAMSLPKAASTVPTITSLGSTSGCAGTSITINGTNLAGATAANVKIGGTAVTSITSNTATQIVAVIGTGTTGTVTVTNASGTATGSSFTVNTAPTTSNAGIDQSGSNSSFTLAANTPTVGTGAWSIVSGSSTLLSQFSSTTNPAAIFTPAVSRGSYVLRWTISNGSCTASTDDVVISNCTNNLIMNGDFANSTAGNNNAASWTKATTFGSYVEVNPENTYFSSGNNDLTAELDSEASLRQVVTVVPGVSYTVSFIYTRRADGSNPTTRGVTVKITGGSSDIISTGFTTNSSTPQIGTFTFTPTSSSIGVEFYNTLHGNSTLGTIIDNIVLIPTSQLAPVATTVPKGNFKTLTSCAGVPVQLNVENVPASGVTYAWTGSAGAVFSPSASIINPTITFTGSGIQVATVTATTASGCSSNSSTTYVNVSAAPTLTIVDPVAVCSPGTVSITTTAVQTVNTGTTTRYYTTLALANAGGASNIAAPSAIAASGTYYIRSAFASGCYTVKPVTVTINTSPSAPTGTAAQSFCSGASQTVTNLTATGTAIKWYAASSGGSVLASTTALVNGTHYYATQTTSGCESPTRFDVTATINASPSAPTGTATQSFCLGASPTVANLTAAGTAIQWYAASSGGSTLASTTALVNGTHYYAAQTTSNCESTTRFDVTVIVNNAPAITTQPSSHSVCEAGDTSFNVVASGFGLTYQWQLSTNSGSSFSNLSNSGVYSNVTTATMNITAATIAMNNYQYRCVISGSCTPFVTTSAVTLTVNTDSGNISLNGGTPLASNSFVLYCPSTTATFSIAPVTGAASYTWVVPRGWTVSGNGTNMITVTTGTSLQSGTVSVMTDNIFCPSHVWVTLSSIAPAALAISKIDPICATPTGTVIATPPAVAGTLTYTLIKTSVIPEVTVGQNSTGRFTGLTGGDYAVTYQINSGCYSVRSNPVSIVPLSTNTWREVSGVKGWSKGVVPTINDYVVFDADYSLPVSVNSCSCVINPGKNVTITSGLVLNIINGLDVQGTGTLTFNNNASLVQLKDDAINHGIITYKRTTPGLKDLDYEYWSSPVGGQTLGNLWSSDRYFRYTNGAWEAQTSAATMDIARGYIIRVRTSSPPFYQSVEFKGTPNNGIKSITAQGANKSNLIGNPYPSAVDATKFITNNEIVGGALYFWTHFTARKLNVTGNKYIYNADDYAVFNLTGGTAPVSNKEAVLPDGRIAAGQAFFVVSDQEGDFTFDNSMRFDTDDAIIDNSQFFKPSNTKKEAKIEKDRVWLNLTNDGGAFKQLLVGYVTGATNDFDKLYDGVTKNSNSFVDFYSVNNSKNCTIQGRALPFDKADEVILGYKSTIAGTFQIGIDNVDGGMVNQAIYLEDKLTGSIHDLKAGSYSFTTEIGTFNDRFVLRYTNTSKLSTGDAAIKGKGVFVSVRNREIKINSFDQNLASVKVYDLKGSLLYNKEKVDKNEFIVDTLNASNQFMIVMMQLEDGKWISEEIIFHD
jgi:hypothetical protein